MGTDKRIALITGATSGIGEATARLFAEQGWDLIVTGRRADRLKSLKKELTGEHDIKMLALAFDIRDRHQIDASLGSLPQHFRRIDILVNNAGLASGLEHIDEGSPLDWEPMIDTNIKGLLYTTRLVARQMIAQGSGHIVNIGSIAGRQVYENGAVYCATKHAVRALSQGMRMDFVRHGIKVTEIRPGMVETEFSEVRFHGDAQLAATVYEGVEALAAEDIAEAILWAVIQPAHVNIDEIALTPQQQASAYYTFRK